MEQANITLLIFTWIEHNCIHMMIVFVFSILERLLCISISERLHYCCKWRSYLWYFHCNNLILMLSQANDFPIWELSFPFWKGELVGKDKRKNSWLNGSFFHERYDWTNFLLFLSWWIFCHLLLKMWSTLDVLQSSRTNWLYARKSFYETFS